jgi:hypothetical protein
MPYKVAYLMFTLLKYLMPYSVADSVADSVACSLPEPFTVPSILHPSESS